MKHLGDIFTSKYSSIYAQELQQGQTTSGETPEQSVTNTPRTPGGLVLFRREQTSEGICPVRSLSLRKATPVFEQMHR